MTLILNNILLFRKNILIFSKLNLNIYPGQCILLNGPNGSGKTTFLEFLYNIHFSQTGFVKKNENSFFFIDINNFFDPNFTIKEHLNFWNKCFNNIKLENKLLDYFELKKIYNKKPNEISWGQKKRLNLAILTLINKNIWLLDEPFTGLDIKASKQLIKLCKNHLKNKGVIIIAHHNKLPFYYHQEIKFPMIEKNNNLLNEISEQWY